MVMIVPKAVVYAYTLPLHQKSDTFPKKKKKGRRGEEKKLPKRVHRMGASKPCGRKATAWYKRSYIRNKVDSSSRDPAIECLALRDFFGW